MLQNQDSEGIVKGEDLKDGEKDDETMTDVET